MESFIQLGKLAVGKEAPEVAAVLERVKVDESGNTASATGTVKIADIKDIKKRFKGKMPF